MTIDISYFKAKLEKEKKLLINELSGISTPRAENPENWDEKETEEAGSERADSNLVADKQEDIEERHAVSNELEIRLKEVNDALGRIEKGDYGICSVGWEEIENERLEANPAATTCKKHLSG